MRSAARRALAFTSLGLAMASAGCSLFHPRTAAKAPSSTASAPAKAPPAPAAAPTLPGHLARADVDHVLPLGPPWLLGQIQVQEVIDGSNKFIGWRLNGLPEEWGPVDLKPGDVVMRVNGKTLETPEEAWEAWKSVARAYQLRIAFQRDGAVRELSLPIDGEPSAAVIRSLDQDAPPPRAPGAPRGVVQIGGEVVPEGDADEAY